MVGSRRTAHRRQGTLRRAGVAAAVAIGFLAPTGTAEAAKDECAPAKEMVTALVEQFGLTQSQARDQIRAECKASAIRGPAMQAAGDAFAGAYYDKALGRLVVAVTDEAVFGAVLATGAQPKLVSASLAELEQDLHVLDSRTTTKPPEVTSWWINEEANTVVVDVAGGPSQAVKTFVAGRPHVTVRYGQPPVGTTADLVGGIAITSTVGRCSLGFNARNSAGTVYVLTAGHCTKNTTTWSGSAGVIGTQAGSSFPTNDYGRIQRTNTAWVPTSKMLATPPNTQTVLGNAPAAVGTTVCRAGSTTGYRCGTLLAMNQTVSYAEGIVYGLGRTNACSEPGDSGGPFISSSRQAQGVASGRGGNCTSGGTTFFQPVNEILSVYGLTLVTG